MPRPPRIIVPGLPHHITQRGNYQQQVFYRDDDRRLYLSLLKEFALHYGTAVEAYCLMPNHVHLILVPRDRDSLPALLRRVHGEYARSLHLRLRRVGHLWQSRYHAVAMEENHFWSAMVYVERNPCKAGLAPQPWLWRWSSARAHLGLVQDELLNQVTWRSSYTPETWKRCLEFGLQDAALFDRIREATMSGRPFGSEEFLDRLTRQTGREVRKRTPGRKPNSHQINDVSACAIGN